MNVRGTATGRISVIIPVCNGEQYLGEALESVFGQTLRPDEVLVVDDGSTDGSIDIVRRFPSARCLSQVHAGQAHALNTGIAQTEGEFLAFLDADDRWLPEKLKLQASVLSATSDVDMVFGHARQFVEPDRRSSAEVVTHPLPARLPSSMLLRRSAWRRAGAFSKEWAVGSVIEWCARVEDRALRWIMMNEVVYERRIHTNNSSANPGAAHEYARAIKYILEERRRARSSHLSAPAAPIDQSEVTKHE